MPCSLSPALLSMTSGPAVTSLSSPRPEPLLLLWFHGVGGHGHPFKDELGCLIWGLLGQRLLRARRWEHRGDALSSRSSATASSKSQCFQSLICNLELNSPASLPQVRGVMHPNSPYTKSRDVNNTINVYGHYLDYQHTNTSLKTINRIVDMVSHYVDVIREIT